MLLRCLCGWFEAAAGARGETYPILTDVCFCLVVWKVLSFSAARVSWLPVVMDAETAVMRTRFECLAIRGMGTLREEDGKVDEEFNQRARGRAWQALKVGGVFSDVGQRRGLVREKTSRPLRCRCGGEVIRVHVNRLMRPPHPRAGAAFT